MSRQASESVPEVLAKRQPRVLRLAAAGVRTGQDFARMMSALMSDVIEGLVTPAVANAAVNAGGKMLKMVDLQLRHGQPTGEPGQKDLQLCGPTEEGDDQRFAQIAKLRAELDVLEEEVRNGQSDT